MGAADSLDVITPEFPADRRGTSIHTKSRLIWIASPDEDPGEESDETPKLENANQRFAFSLIISRQPARYEPSWSLSCFTRGLIRGFIRGAFLAL